MGDVDDVDVYAAQPIYEWQQTPKGQWAMENAHNLTYHTMQDHTMWGHRIVIRGEITDAHKVTEYYLRWPKHE